MTTKWILQLSGCKEDCSDAFFGRSLLAPTTTTTRMSVRMHNTKHPSLHLQSNVSGWDPQRQQETKPFAKKPTTPMEHIAGASMGGRRNAPVQIALQEHGSTMIMCFQPNNAYVSLAPSIGPPLAWSTGWRPSLPAHCLPSLEWTGPARQPCSLWVDPAQLPRCGCCAPTPATKVAARVLCLCPT